MQFPIFYSHFDYSPLWHDPFSTAAYLAIIISIISLYFFQNNTVRVMNIAVALSLGIYSHRINGLGVIVLTILGGLFYFSWHGKFKWQIIARAGALLLSIGMMFALVPGFLNWQLVSNFVLTPDAIPYSMRFTFDKSFVGLLFLCFSPLTLIKPHHGWKPVLQVGITAGVLAIMILLPLSYALHYVRLEIKNSDLISLWLINNLFFVCIAEEVIFRGIIQKSLQQVLDKFAVGKWIALVISAALFGASHYQGGINYVLLASVAGIIYGYAFMKTQKIEASIITHFMVNTVHFLAFTYPALQSAFIAK